MINCSPNWRHVIHSLTVLLGNRYSDYFLYDEILLNLTDEEQNMFLEFVQLSEGII